MRFHWQNLTKDENKGRAPRAGRAWLHFGKNRTLGAEWNLFSGKLGLGFDLNTDEGEIEAHFRLWLLDLFMSLGGIYRLVERIAPKRRALGGRSLLPASREINVYWHDFSLWWSLWMDPMEHRSTDPRWRRGNLNFADLLLGKAKYVCEDLGPQRPINVWMPERVYVANVTPQRSTWKRPLWFARVRESWLVDIPGGIPTESDDWIWGLSVTARSKHEAAAAIRERIFEARRKDSGSRDWIPPVRTATA